MHTICYTRLLKLFRYSQTVWYWFKNYCITLVTDKVVSRRGWMGVERRRGEKLYEKGSRFSNAYVIRTSLRHYPRGLTSCKYGIGNPEETYLHLHLFLYSLVLDPPFIHPNMSLSTDPCSNQP